MSSVLPACWIEPGAVQHQVADGDASGRLSWKKEAGRRESPARQRSEPAAAPAERRRRRCRPSREMSKPVGWMMRPSSPPISMILLRARFALHRPCRPRALVGRTRSTSPLAACWKSTGIFERADDVRRQTADRAKHLNAKGSRRRGRKEAHDEREGEDAAHHRVDVPTGPRCGH